MKQVLRPILSSLQTCLHPNPVPNFLGPTVYPPGLAEQSSSSRMGLAPGPLADEGEL